MDAHRPAAPAGGYPAFGGQRHSGGLGGGSITSRAIQPLLDSDPRQIGPYAIRGRLGQGAMGHVYLAFAPTGPAYALKVLRPDFASDGDFRRRFAREISAARAVHSPFVNAVTDADPDAPTPWLASYFIPGPPLNAAINLAGPFSPRSVAHLGVGIGLALQAIHTAGVVHRDLKPGNVLVASDGPRVIDFGIARAADASMLTSTGMRLGTPSFMAPEQVSGANVGAAADVWAIGGMLVYAATGRTPFGDGNAMAILYRVENHEPDLDDLDPALAAIVERCLEKDPEARPTPAKLVELCRAALYGGAQGIPVLPGSDSTGWLPSAISRDLASRAVELAAVRQNQVGIPLSGAGAAGAGLGGAGSVAGAAGAAAGPAVASGGKGRGLLGRKAKGAGRSGPGGAPGVAAQGAGPQGVGPQGGPQGAGPQGYVQPSAGPGPQSAGPRGYGPLGGAPAPAPQNYAPQNYPAAGPQGGPQNHPVAGPQGAPQNYPPAGPQGGPQNHPAAGQQPGWNAAPPRTVPEGSPAPTLPQGSSVSPTGAGPQGASKGPSAPVGAPGVAPWNVTPSGAAAPVSQPASPAAGTAASTDPASGSAAPAAPASDEKSPNASARAEAAPPKAAGESSPAAFSAPVAPVGSPAEPDEPKGPAWATALSHRAAAEPVADLGRSLISTPSDDASRGPAAAGSMPWGPAAPPAGEPVADGTDQTDQIDQDGKADSPAASGPFRPSGSIQARPSAGSVGSAADQVPPGISPSPTGLPAGFRQIDEEPKKVAEVKSAAFAAPVAPVAPESAQASGGGASAADDDTSSTKDDLLSSFGSPAGSEADEPHSADSADSTDGTDGADRSDEAADHSDSPDEPRDSPDAVVSKPAAASLFAAPVPPRSESAEPSAEPSGNPHDVTTPLATQPSKWDSAKSETVPSPWSAPVSNSASSANDATVINPLPKQDQRPPGPAKASPTPQSAPVSSTASSANDATVINPLPRQDQRPPAPAKASPTPQSAAAFGPPPPGAPMPRQPMPGAPTPRGPVGPGGPGGPAAPGSGFGPPAAAPTHLTVIPPPPSMSSPYGQPGQPGQPGPNQGPGGPKGPGLPLYHDRSSSGPGRPPGVTDPGARNKRLAMIIGGAVLAVGGLGAAAVAMTSGSPKKPVTAPSVSNAPTSAATSQAQSPTPGPGQDSTPPTASAPSSAALTGIPGKTAGVVGAQDVVLRGLYGAAAGRDFALICSSVSVSAQQSAAKQAGWTGKGDAAPACAKFYERVWGALDPASLRAVKVLSTKQGADAKHQAITVDDASDDGKTPYRTFNVSWNGQRWIIG